ncbi:MAG: galactose-1-phosphate uridylyltransferase [candidate division NC10 bacterium]|nr:galactose-1-phosphate uridylyltransferase [candidate division NC10 bacterium]
MSELRRDPITGRWVIISGDRRKEDFRSAGEALEEMDPCPFCPGNEELTPPEIIAYREEGSKPDKPGWWTRVFANKFPVLRIEGDLNRRGIGLFDLMDGIGAHEIIVETPDHTRSLVDLGDHELEKVFWAYRDRILDLRKDPRMKYVLIFKNHGRAAGARVPHAHSQLIALPVIPKAVQEELAGAGDYFRLKERCIFCDINRQELELQERLLLENKNFLAYVPFAARFPFEIWVIPKQHRSCFTGFTKEEMMDLARILRGALVRLSLTLGNPPFNYLLHGSPYLPATDKEAQRVEASYHWHLEIMPRLLRVAGFEWGTGFYINPVSPEKAAVQLRLGV